MSDERCKESIDLEEFLSMNVGKKYTKVKAEIVYTSGRTEMVYGKLKTDQTPEKNSTMLLKSLSRSLLL
jgi:hypothetical protein